KIEPFCPGWWCVQAKRCKIRLDDCPDGKDDADDQQAERNEPRYPTRNQAERAEEEDSRLSRGKNGLDQRVVAQLIIHAVGAVIATQQTGTHEVPQCRRRKPQLPLDLVFLKAQTAAFGADQKILAQSPDGHTHASAGQCGKSATIEVLERVLQRGFAADIFDCQRHVVCGLPLPLSSDPLKPLANQLQLERLDVSRYLDDSAHTTPGVIGENALDRLRVVTKRPRPKGGVNDCRRAGQRLCGRVQ